MKKNYIIPALRVVNSNLDLDICEVSLEVTDKPANPDPSNDLVKERDEWTEGLW